MVNWQTYMNDNISVPVSHAAYSSPRSSPRRDRKIQAPGGVASASDDKKPFGSAVFDSAASLSPCTPGRIIVMPALPRASEPDADMYWAKSLGREARIRVEEETRRTSRDGHGDATRKAHAKIASVPVKNFFEKL